MRKYPESLDLHMHSTVSDGTDTPEEILKAVKQAGIKMFAVTDHDTFDACAMIRRLLAPGDPVYVNGIEFSCKDEEGQYHILGYRFDEEDPGIRHVVEQGHLYRRNKMQARLDHLKSEFGIEFSKDDVENVRNMQSGGKPHLANLLVKYGHAGSVNEAFHRFLNKLHTGAEYVRPEEAIEGILSAGGIPVLAHPSFGSGNELVFGENMNRRLKRLTGFGLQGVEAFYSGFTPEIQQEMLDFAGQYELYISAGSDYHGLNKTVKLLENHLGDPNNGPEGLKRFLDELLKD